MGYRTESLVWLLLCSYVRPVFTCRLVVIALVLDCLRQYVIVVSHGRAVVYLSSFIERSAVMLKTFSSKIKL